MFGWSINVGPSSVSSGKSMPQMRGLFTGTLVATETGWRPVEQLSAGDKIWTFDNGLQPLEQIEPHLLWSEGGHKRLRAFLVPAGGLGNEKELMMLGTEGLLLECENASDVMGDPFAVIPIEALDGVCGISEKRKPGSQVLYTLRFAAEEAIYIDSGLLVHCPRTDGTAGDAEQRYDVKTLTTAQAFLTDLDLAELALREPDEEFFGEMASDRVA